MQKKFHLCLLLAAAFLVSSCEKDSLQKTDYSINSTEHFELLSQHDNGWIKQARHGGDLPSEEYEYYENGYIKSAKIYSHYPEQHLYMEVNRSEDNKPLWSKYYTPEGELWFETEYENGLAAVKKVYSEKGTSIHTYTEGELTAVEFTSADGSSTSSIIYNRSEGSKKLTLVRNGATVFEEEYAHLDHLGDGMLTGNFLPLANPFSDSDAPFIEAASQFLHSSHWEFSADPIEVMRPYHYYYGYDYPSDKFAVAQAVNSDLYQSVIEQYPVTEDEVLRMNFELYAGKASFIPSFEESQALEEELNQDPALFELKYGNEYVSEIHYGNYIFIIGALRNMPTDSNAARELKSLAERRMVGIINSDNDLSAEDLKKLDKVWFEIRFFSSLKKHRNGVILNSSEDYNAAVNEVLEAEPSVIQLEYMPYSHLFY